MYPLIAFAAVLGAIVAVRRGWVPLPAALPGAGRAAAAAAQQAAVDGQAAELARVTAELRAAEERAATAEAASRAAAAAQQAAALNLRAKAAVRDPDTSAALAEANRARDAAEAAAAEARDRAAEVERAAAARTAAAARAAQDVARLSVEEDRTRRELDAATLAEGNVRRSLVPLGTAISRTLSGITRYPEVWRFALTDGGMGRVPYDGPIRAVADDSTEGFRVAAERAQAASGYASPTHVNVRLTTPQERGLVAQANTSWDLLVSEGQRADSIAATIPNLRAAHDSVFAALSAARAALAASAAGAATPMGVTVPTAGVVANTPPPAAKGTGIIPVNILTKRT